MLKITERSSIFIVLLIGFILIGTLLLGVFNSKRNDINYSKTHIPYINYNPAWADSVITKLSKDEKVGQKVIIKITEINDSIRNEIILLIKNKSISGIKFETDSLEYISKLIQEFKELSPIPLYFIHDIWKKTDFGNNAQFNLANDAITDFAIKEKMNNYIVSSIKYSGLNIYRIQSNKYFENKFDTIYFYRKYHDFSTLSDTLQSLGIISAIDGFPIYKHKKSMKNKYQELISMIKSAGTGMVFVKNSAPDTELFLKYLTDSFNYQGITIADFTNLENKKNIIESSADLVMIPYTSNSQIINLIQDLKASKISENIFNKNIHKILLSKHWLDSKSTINQEFQIPNEKEYQLLQQHFIENSIVLINNVDSVIPFGWIGNKSFQIIIIGESDFQDFTTQFKKYAPALIKRIPKDNTNWDKSLQVTNKQINTVLLVNNFLPDSSFILAIKKISQSGHLTIVNFGSENTLEKYLNSQVLLQVFGNNAIAQKSAAQILFGGIPAKGELPLNLNDTITIFHGFCTKKTRLKYTIPEEVNVSSEKLRVIDSIVNHALSICATPGCQVFVAKNGCVIFNKSYGYHDYSRTNHVKNTDVFDIASATKIIATTLATMKMYDQGKISLDEKIGKYFKNTKIEYLNQKSDTFISYDTLKLSEVKDIKKLLKTQDTINLNDSMIVAFQTIIVNLTPSNNIFKVTPQELLIHKSGILPVLPLFPYVLYKHFYYYKTVYKLPNLKVRNMNEFNIIKKQLFKLDEQTVINFQNDNFEAISNHKEEIGKIYQEYYSSHFIPDSANIQIADGMYFRKQYFDSLWNDTKRLPVYSRKIYEYSDINMIIMQMIIDSINKKPLNRYLETEFYNPLGLENICFQPLKKFSRDRIMPTENDRLWRNQVVHGYVHDPSAAILGGIAGNAGLFSNAENIGVICQMWLNKGTYGGIRYLKTSTVSLFTRTQNESHRGLGFDKPAKKNIIAESASQNSYGHTGFTGCVVWVDPDNELIYVFLSNRVHPSQNNWKLNSLQVRQKIHQAIYDAFLQ